MLWLIPLCAASAIIIGSAIWFITAKIRHDPLDELLHDMDRHRR